MAGNLLVVGIWEGDEMRTDQGCACKSVPGRSDCLRMGKRLSMDWKMKSWPRSVVQWTTDLRHSGGPLKPARVLFRIVPGSEGCGDQIPYPRKLLVHS
jgi:hypothetical protein